MKFLNLLWISSFIMNKFKCKEIVALFFFSFCNSRTYRKNVLSLILRRYFAFRARDISNIPLNSCCVSHVFLSHPQSRRMYLLKDQDSCPPLFSFPLSRALSLHFFIVNIFFAVGFPLVASRIGSNKICLLTNLSFIHFDKSLYPLIRNFSNCTACMYAIFRIEILLLFQSLLWKIFCLISSGFW